MIDIAAKLAALHDSIGFDEKKHAYTVDGQNPIPVTSVCNIMAKPFLIGWAAKLAREGKDWRRESKAAAEMGKRVHRAAENWVLELLGQPKLPQEHDTESAYLAANMIGWLEMKASAEIQFPFKPEQRLWHPEHGYGGTADLPALWKGCPTVFDIKTVGGEGSEYEDWRPQSAAYRKALKFHTGIDWIGAIIRVPKDGSAPNVLLLGDDDADFEAFLGLLTVYKWTKRGSRKANVVKAAESFVEARS